MRCSALVEVLPVVLGKPTFHDFVHTILRSHFPPATTALNDGTEESAFTPSYTLLPRYVALRGVGHSHLSSPLEFKQAYISDRSF